VSQIHHWENTSYVLIIPARIAAIFKRSLDFHFLPVLPMLHLIIDYTRKHSSFEVNSNELPSIDSIVIFEMLIWILQKFSEILYHFYQAIRYSYLS